MSASLQYYNDTDTNNYFSLCLGCCNNIGDNFELWFNSFNEK